MTERVGWRRAIERGVMTKNGFKRRVILGPLVENEKEKGGEKVSLINPTKSQRSQLGTFGQGGGRRTPSPRGGDHGRCRVKKKG